MMLRGRASILAALPALWCAGGAWAHDAHGRSTSPPEARHLASAIPASKEHAEAGRAQYQRLCAECHGADGKSHTPAAAKMTVRPTDLSHYLMESMRDGEIYWVVTHGIDKTMPAVAADLSDEARWELVQYVRELRRVQRESEKARLGPYDWNLPPGFPYPNVPEDNPMTAEKVELGRHLFYDRRLSLNQTQSCATCHKQELAFTDGRGRGKGSTGELHPRGPMSLVNVAYAPVLTWANPLVRQLEAQALVPMFGDHPVELGMTGKEDLLAERLREEPRYRQLFPAAFPGQPDPYTVGNVTKAIASFERTILSGDSPYDRYQRGDDPQAISEAARRGESLFYSERTECFHCHGGFNFTGSVDYLDKGFPEIEFHNNGLYNMKGRFAYPEDNLGLYEFTQDPGDVGKFKAPTLRNIALTAPYMHDGSIACLEGVVNHYNAGGRAIKSGPRAGNGANNPDKSEFIRRIGLSAREKADIVAFLRSLTDESVLTDQRFADPWEPAAARREAARPRFVLHGQVARVFPDTGTVALYHDAVPGLLGGMKPPNSMEFVVANAEQLKQLRPGEAITAEVRRQGRDFVLDNISPGPPPATKP